MSLLSIIIPTYNRAEYLEENLGVLLPQIIKYSNDVDFAITDNCSTDDTEKIVYAAQMKYPSIIKYYKHEENIGSENNFLFSINRAEGKYVYLLGDDDVVSSNFLDIIIPILKEERDIDACFLNRLSGDEKGNNNRLVDNNYCGSIEILDNASFLKKVLNKAGFISSIIFKKTIWDCGSSFYRDSYDGFKYYGRIVGGLALSKGYCLYYFFPIVIQRNAYRTWIKYWPLYHISSMSNIFYDIDNLVPGIYDKWGKMLRKSIRGVLPAIMFHKDYYRKPEIRAALLRHMTKLEKFKMCCYLYFPFSNSLFLFKNKVVKLFVALLKSWR